MDKDLLIQNVIRCCEEKNERPTNACINAGVGKDFIGNLRNSKSTSVEKVAALAAYLGVTTSDLVGDGRSPPQSSAISELYDLLNEEGQEILLDYAEHLVTTKKYTERGPLPVDAEAANK